MSERFTWPPDLGPEPEQDDGPGLDQLASKAQVSPVVTDDQADDQHRLRFGGVEVAPSAVAAVLLGSAWTTVRPGSFTLEGTGRQAGCTFNDGSSRRCVTTVGEIGAVRLKWSA